MDKEAKIRLLYMIVLVSALLFLISPFFIPIIFAATIALTLKPLHSKIVRKGLSCGQAAGILTTLFAIVISIPVSFFIVKGTTSVTKALEQLALNNKLREQGVQEIVKDIRHDFILGIQKFSGKHDFLSFLNEKKIEEYLNITITYLLDYLKSFLAQLPTLFILLLIMLLCTYSFLTHSHSIRLFCQKLFGFSDEKMEQITHIFIMDSRAVYLSNMATGAIQSFLVAAGVTFLGIGDFFLVFFITLILSFIPVIGAAPVAFIFAGLAFFRENTTASIILVVLGIFTGVVDNFLRPWLATLGETKIPAVFAFICVIGGALWLGFPGLFIGLLIGSYSYDTLPIFWEELESKKDRDVS
jgi:predicted PurR-regulated permease PerM